MAFLLTQGDVVVEALVFSHLYDMPWLTDHCTELVRMHGDQVLNSEDWLQIQAEHPEVAKLVLRAHSFHSNLKKESYYSALTYGYEDGSQMWY